MGCANAEALLANSPPALALLIKSGVKNTAKSSSSDASFADYSHTSYKITQSTRKINTALVRKGADLLVHFSKPNNQVVMQVTDVQGKVVNATHHANMEAGFYEIPVLPSNNEPSLYFVSLIVNQQVYSFQVSFRP
ncbi:hypothetical protein [Tunicatimonas pelagia]|uniref:hypothetical protein n=1 Tax=Tunicatimonas pelagia TaxID=931531 RepID=UPI002665158A|nr:hypothetical protein [Tunicatimonas pelagia]WKN45858.1 hypothetical protein P0M28_12900 [Tunicatimonas pelagia]